MNNKRSCEIRNEIFDATLAITRPPSSRTHEIPRARRVYASLNAVARTRDLANHFCWSFISAKVSRERLRERERERGRERAPRRCVLIFLFMCDPVMPLSSALNINKCAEPELRLRWYHGRYCTAIWQNFVFASKVSSSLFFLCRCVTLISISGTLEDEPAMTQPRVFELLASMIH